MRALIVIIVQGQLFPRRGNSRCRRRSPATPARLPAAVENEGDSSKFAFDCDSAGKGFSCHVSSHHHLWEKCRGQRQIWNVDPSL